MRAFITGASSGLGRALAHHYARQGATLGLVARGGDALADLNAQLGGGHATYRADVGDPAALARAAAEFMANGGVADIVIANAGISVGTLAEFAEDLAVFDAVMRTNWLGTVATFQPFIGPMRAAGRGKLVGIASVSGIRGLAGAGAYCASKAAVITLLESLRVELRGTGIQVITICPGYIATPLTAVNPYHMPFLLQADDAAARIARLIARGANYAVLPWQMAIVAKLLRLLPNPLFDRIAQRFGRKPRAHAGGSSATRTAKE